MATTEAELDLFAVEIGTQFKNTRALVGLLANLTTTAKGDLVAAVNEVNAKPTGASINDTTASTTNVYSSSKVNTLTGLAINLTTTTKADLVAAINEVNAKPTGASINDTTASTTNVYSSNKVNALTGLAINLTTTTKADLVSAINEVNAKPTGASINDTTPATTTTYSSSKSNSITGLPASLTTTTKANLVAAINEVNAKPTGASINDTTPATTTAYSSSKVNTAIDAAIATSESKLLGGAGPTIDTLKEIADLLAASDLNDDNAIAALTTSLGYRIRFDAIQTVTALQKVQGNSNLGSVSIADFGNTAHSYRDVLLGALV